MRFEGIVKIKFSVHWVDYELKLWAMQINFIPSEDERYRRISVFKFRAITFTSHQHLLLTNLKCQWKSRLKSQVASLRTGTMVSFFKESLKPSHSHPGFLMALVISRYWHQFANLTIWNNLFMITDFWKHRHFLKDLFVYYNQFLLILCVKKYIPVIMENYNNT